MVAAGLRIPSVDDPTFCEATFRKSAVESLHLKFSLNGTCGQISAEFPRTSPRGDFPARILAEPHRM